MVIRTTYSRSISISDAQMQELSKWDTVLVIKKGTEIPLARLNTSTVLEKAQRIPIEGKDGKMRLSKYYVYSF